jgi:hypothetical protein
MCQMNYKPLFVFFVVCMVLSSCTKAGRHQVNIRIKNSSAFNFENFRLTGFQGGNGPVHTDIHLGIIKMGETSPYVGFNSFVIDGNIPLLGFTTSCNGWTVSNDRYSIWCGTSAEMLENGFYTIELYVQSDRDYIWLFKKE